MRNAHSALINEPMSFAVWIASSWITRFRCRALVTRVMAVAG
jgi:hypothetical protein